MAKAKVIETKISINNREEYKEIKSELTIAGGGMIVPNALRQNGETFSCIGTGTNEFRLTKKSMAEPDAVPVYYGVAEVEIPKVGKMFLLSNEYIEKGQNCSLTVRSTTPDKTKPDIVQWSAELIVGDIPTGIAGKEIDSETIAPTEVVEGRVN